jgi:hypothetical protein
MRAAHVFLALAALPVSRARGDAQTVVPFRVEFSSGVQCGTPDGFAAELSKRSQHVRPASGVEPAFAFQIDVRDNEGTLEGRLTLREPGGRITVRVVPGATCGEVIPALAVIAAVLVEPSAVVEQPVRPPPAPARPEPTGWAVGASAGLVAQGAVAPEIRRGFAVEASVAYEAGGVLNPLFALAYLRTQMGTVEKEIGTAELVWWTVRASLCPARWPDTGRLALRPCALFDLGRLDAEGKGIDLPAESSMTWVAPGASARLDAAPLDWLWFTAEAGVFRPLNRDVFLFDPPRVDAYQPPRVGGFGRLAVGGRFQ